MSWLKRLFGRPVTPVVTVPATEADSEAIRMAVADLCWKTGRTVIANRQPDGSVVIRLLPPEPVTGD